MRAVHSLFFGSRRNVWSGTASGDLSERKVVLGGLAASGRETKKKKETKNYSVDELRGRSTLPMPYARLIDSSRASLRECLHLKVVWPRKKKSGDLRNLWNLRTRQSLKFWKFQKWPTQKSDTPCNWVQFQVGKRGASDRLENREFWDAYPLNISHFMCNFVPTSNCRRASILYQPPFLGARF